MNRRVAGAVLALSAIAVHAPAQAPRLPPGERGPARSPYAFTTIDFPGASITQAYGINAAGDIVGTYRNAAPRDENHGFVLRAGVLTAIDYPGSDTKSTIATAIDSVGDIVGTYALTNAPPGNGHGFLLSRSGSWTSVDYPGDQLMSGPYRILDDGMMVGCFHYGNPATSMYGYVRAPDGRSTPFAYPRSPGQPPYAMHYGATPDGTIVGVYVTPNAAGRFGPGTSTHGYVVAHGETVPFDVPGSTMTMPMDITSTGLIVGAYRDSRDGASAWHGFVADMHGSPRPAEWTFALPVDVPGATVTRLRGVNAAGVMVGDYVGSDGKDHAFVARPL